MSSAQLGISQIGVSFPDNTFGDEDMFGIPFVVRAIQNIHFYLFYILFPPFFFCLLLVHLQIGFGIGIGSFCYVIFCNGITHMKTRLIVLSMQRAHVD
jgi:hypothetical protein